MRARGTSLWLLPEPSARDRLTALIAGLAERFAAPAFEPHLTLRGDLRLPEPDVLAAAEQLARATAPLALRAPRVGARDEFFRCLFLEAAPQAALSAARARADALLGGPGERAFFPHVSLLYAELDAGSRARLLDELSPLVPFAARLDRLQVVRTEGEVGDWRVRAAFALSGRD